MFVLQETLVPNDAIPLEEKTNKLYYTMLISYVDQEV
jgi:hypothetical protein